MGAEHEKAAVESRAAGPAADRPIVVRARPSRQSDSAELVAHAGEIVGLAGLSGHGQTELLLDVFNASMGHRPGIEVASSTALVAGDRQTDGIFPLWSIGENIGIRSIACIPPRAFAVAAARGRTRRGLAATHQYPHAGHPQSDPLPFRRQPAEGALRARARLRRQGHPDGRPDARRGLRHEARGLRPHPLRGRRRPHVPLVHDRARRAGELRPRLRLPQRPDRRRPRPRRADRGEGHPVLLRGRFAKALPPNDDGFASWRGARTASGFGERPPAHPHAAAGAVADPDPSRHRLPQSARDQLFRLQPDAQSGDPDRARDDRPDVHPLRERPRSLDRHVRQLRRLRHGDLAARRAALRCARPDRLHRPLCRSRRADLPPRPSFDRRDARHELRLAGARDPSSAAPGRQGARLAARADELQAAACPLPDHRGARDRASSCMSA